MPEPLFLGTTKRRPVINLSGANATHRDAKAQRAERERVRLQHKAATVIQKRWRAHHVRTSCAQAWANAYDSYSGTDLIIATRLLVYAFSCSTDDLKRYSKWCRTVVTNKTLFVDMDSPHWKPLMQKSAVHMLRLAKTAPPVALFFEVVKQLLDPARYPATMQAKATARTVTDYLNRHDMYECISDYIYAIPPEKKTTASLPSAISLSLLPLKAFPDDVLVVTSFVKCILTIPSLLYRLPAPVLTSFAASIPYDRVIPNCCFRIFLLCPAPAVHVLANLAPLVEPRLSTFKADVLIGWLDLLHLYLDRVPDDVFATATSKGKQKAKDQTDEMDIDDVYPSIRDVSSLAPTALAQLRKLASPSVLEPLLAASAKFSSSPQSRPALARFILNLLFALPPRQRDDVLSLLVYNKYGGSGLLREIWRGWLRSGSILKSLAGTTGKAGWEDVIKQLSSQSETAKSEWPLLVLFVQMYTKILVTLGDDEFYATSAAVSRNPLNLDEIKSFSGLLRNVGFALYWSEMTIEKVVLPGVLRVGGEELRSLVRGLLVAIHERDSRKPFLPKDHFTMTMAFDVESFIKTALLEDQRMDEEEEVAASRIEQDDDLDSSDEDSDHGDNTTAEKNALYRVQAAYFSPRLAVLNNIPFVISFETRVQVFRELVELDKEREYMLNNQRRFDRTSQARNTATIRRNHIADDGFIHLHSLGPSGLKKRLQIIFVDEHGLPESGIDGGGLFKEFLTALGKEAFDTDRGLWLSNTNQEVYPAPHAYAREATSLEWYTFLGQIIGKALYEGILVSVPFAGFFLSKWLGKASFIDDLASLDPELYSGLVYLKNYKGDVRELNLTFSIDQEDMGVSRTIDLVPGGRDVEVTNENRFKYITLISHFRLNAQIREQSAAFVRGLYDLIKPRWLRLFSQAELKTLVGGSEQPIDIDDLKRHTVYSDYSESDLTICCFWQVLQEFDEDQKRAFIKFVTSADKAPLLGFGALEPRFAIRGGGSDVTRLPTSSTCVNLLKLPRYEDKEVLKQKLLISIHAQAGFDLS